MALTTMAPGRRVLSGLVWAAAGSAAVWFFFVFLDESDYRVVIAAGVCCGVLRAALPQDALTAIPRQARLFLLEYFVGMYLWQLLQVIAYLGGTPSFFYSKPSLYAWDALAFPTSVVAVFVARKVGGNFGEFIVFGVVPVNTLLIALALGSVVRARTARAANRDVAI